MQCTYSLSKSAVRDESGTVYPVYGIDAVSPRGHVLRSYPDVFFDEKQAARFVEQCNKSELALIHLADVVENALAEQYTVFTI